MLVIGHHTFVTVSCSYHKTLDFHIFHRHQRTTRPAEEQIIQAMGTTDWQLQGCCARDEYIFLGLYFLYGFLIHFLYAREVFYPFKLLAVFVHEMGHGSAAWLTCGKVKSIQVNLDQSGTAAYSGGIQWIVIPAGYVGGAFWGGAFVALSGSRIGATIAACIVSAALLISLA